MTAHETAAIVDPFSTGADLAPEFRRRGWATVAVLSSPTLPELYEGSLRPADFDTVVTHEGDAALTAKRLADAGVAAVLPGTEIGVELADRLAAVLGRPGNGTPGSRARRNKAAMVDALTAAGLPAARTFLTGDAAAAVDWARRFDRWPVVVKPVDSAGADGVTFCDSPGEVREAFDRLHGTRNRMGQHNTQVLLQEMLLGQQYFINSVSRDGTHYIFEIWRDRRHRVAGAGMVCEREDLLPPNGATQDVIRDYVTKVLDALAIRWGAAHTELMLTDRGPVLIETAARMQGTIMPAAVSAATGQNHVTVSVDAVADPDRFAQLAARPYLLDRHVSVVSLIAPRDGVIHDPDVAARFQALPTVFGVLGDLTAGTPVQRTVDLFTSPGFLYLVAADPEAIDRDYAEIRQLEANGLYD